MNKTSISLTVMLLVFLTTAPFIRGDSYGAGEPSGAAETSADSGEDDWDEFDEPPQVEFNPADIRQIGVRGVSLRKKRIYRTIRTAGMVGADERYVRRVTTRVSGWIEKLYADYEGKPVKKGEPIAEIYSPELVATQEEFLLALSWDDDPVPNGGAYDRMIQRDARKILDAARRRLAYWDVTPAQIAALERDRTLRRTITLYAPSDGFVRNKKVDEGARVGAGQPLMEIVDLSRVWILADIYVSEMAFVRVGQKAVITMSAFPGEPLESTITYIYPTLESATRTTQVRFEVPNRDLKLKPMMFSDVEIKVDLGTRWVLPADAVIETGREQIVYVDMGEGAYRPRKVRIGVRAGNFREVISGLRPGETVAAGANFLLDSEAQLRGIFPE